MGQQTKVSNLAYLNQTMGGNKRLVKEIIDLFLKQFPEELSVLNTAIQKEDYHVIKGLAHTMKSSASIMDIGSMIPMLKEMEELGKQTIRLDRIKELYVQIGEIGQKAIEEIKEDRKQYTP